MSRRQPDEGGFALAETLIAAAIIAMMLGLTYQSIGVNAQHTRVIEERALAALVARSALDYVTATGDTRLGGDSAGLRWWAEIAPHEGRKRDAAGLQRVTIMVAKPGAAQPLLQLSSLRLER